MLSLAVVAFDLAAASCEIYEIKHSAELPYRPETAGINE